MVKGVIAGNFDVIHPGYIKFVHIDEEGNSIPIGEKGRTRITKLIEEENEN